MIGLVLIGEEHVAQRKSARALQNQARSLLRSSQKLAGEAKAEEDGIKKLELLVRATTEAEQAESMSKAAAELAQS